MKLMLTTLVLTATLLAAGPAAAGGWAVTTLDSIPETAAGQTVEVGFTIRQHGVTPVDPEGEVGIVIRSVDGVERFFAAEATGEIGHHVALVTFPAAGTWTWAARQGWFAEQALGTIDVAPAPVAAADLAKTKSPTKAPTKAPTEARAAAAGLESTTTPTSAGDYRWPGWVRLSLPVLATGFATAAVADLVASRRRRALVA